MGFDYVFIGQNIVKYIQNMPRYVRYIIIVVILVSVGIYISTTDTLKPPEKPPVTNDWGTFNFLLKPGYYEGNSVGMSPNGGIDLFVELDIQTESSERQDIMTVGFNSEDVANNLYIGSNFGKVYAYVNGVEIQDTVVDISDGGWHHISFRKIGSDCTLTVDDTILSTSGAGIKPVTGKVTVGGDVMFKHVLRGTIKNVMFGTTKIYSQDFKFIKV